MSESRLRLHFEMGETKIDLEGDPDTVTREFLRQLSGVFPNLEIARRLTFTPDLGRLSEALIGAIEFVPEGIILARRDLSAEQAILLCLLGAYLGNRLGRRQDDFLNAPALSKASGKALKTISNQIALMVDEGLVEKMGKGAYRITSLGIKRAESIAGGLKQVGM